MLGGFLTATGHRGQPRPQTRAHQRTVIQRTLVDRKPDRFEISRLCQSIHILHHVARLIQTAPPERLELAQSLLILLTRSREVRERLVAQRIARHGIIQPYAAGIRRDDIVIELGIAER